MKIIVPIKQVPDVRNVKIDEEKGTVIREGMESIVNPLDLHSIETALRIKENLGAEVIVVSMGPMKAIDAIKEAIAMGADKGVLLSDKAFAGSDTWATSLILSRAIEKIGGFDLVICGEKATDGDTGQVGPGIAAFLDVPVLTYISRVENVDSKACWAKRLLENGYEILESKIPCVLTVVKDIAVPRLPTLGGKIKAKSADVQVWGAGDLGIDVNQVGLNGSPTRVVKISRPKLARECEMLFAKDESSIKNAAGRVAEFIKSKEVH